ncbi:hypothetical protein JTB14_034480 [Gonioctena quinquepunctata]|nr:hypothetical protein JTB14_034480 [Gonioctena quinquepunctata]
MWVGYNAKLIKDTSKIQKIDYLRQINNSPTDPAVIKETMRRSLTIASEFGKNYYTYDVAIAKIALRIQSAEEEFARSFINSGPFHILSSYLKAIGKFIDGSGLVNMLVDSEILVKGEAERFRQLPRAFAGVIVNLKLRALSLQSVLASDAPDVFVASSASRRVIAINENLLSESFLWKQLHEVFCLNEKLQDLKEHEPVLLIYKDNIANDSTKMT